MKSWGSSRVWMWKSAFSSTLPPDDEPPVWGGRGRLSSALGAHLLEGLDPLLHRGPERGHAQAEGQEAGKRHPGPISRREGDFPEAEGDPGPRPERGHVLGPDAE